MTTISNYQQPNLKNPKTKTKLSKQLEQEKKWRSHGGLSAGKGRGGLREKVQGISSINGGYKIDSVRSRIV